MNRIWNLVSVEARIEWRERSVLSGLLLYLLSSTFIVFSIWRELPPKEWGLTFWIIFLFCSLMAVLKTFGKESEGRYYYYYTLYHPLELFQAKVLYNFFLLLALYLVLWLVLGIMAGNPVTRPEWFLLTGAVACLAMAFLLTFISSISIRTQQQATLTSVMALPLLIPVLLNVLRLTIYSIGATPDTNPWNEFTLLCGVSMLVIAMSLWLFPYLWRS